MTVLQAGRGRRTPKISVCARACTLVQDARRCSRCTPTSLCSPVTFAEATFSLSASLLHLLLLLFSLFHPGAKLFPLVNRPILTWQPFDDTPVTDLPLPFPITLHRRGGGPRFLRSVESQRTVWLDGKRAFRGATKRSLNPTERQAFRSFFGKGWHQCSDWFRFPAHFLEVPLANAANRNTTLCSLF